MRDDDQAVRLCPYCEGPIPRPKGKTCGDVPCIAQHKREAARRSYQKRRAAGGPRRVGPCETRQCAWCAGSFDVFVSVAQRFCSLSCGNKDRFPRPVEVYVRPAYVPAHAVSKTRWFSCTCRVCGDTFVHTMPGWTCSPACRGALLRAKASRTRSQRRAVMRGAHTERFDRRDVFERDEYVCHICQQPTDPALAVPHPRAPTVDHVVPLARGGHHTLGNCKTAHFMCNSTKGAREDYTHPVSHSPAVRNPQGVGA